MIGDLPKALTVDGREYDIDSDFRTALLIFEAFGDAELSSLNKQFTMLELLYNPIVPPDIDEASKQAVWFLDVGQDEKQKNKNVHNPKTMDYKQDEQLLFSAVNAVATRDVREAEYMHWWTFYGLCQAIDSESLIAHIINIRSKRAKGEKLEKHELKFYHENIHLIEFRTSDEDYQKMVALLRR